MVKSQFLLESEPPTSRHFVSGPLFYQAPAPCPPSICKYRIIRLTTKKNMQSTGNWNTIKFNSLAPNGLIEFIIPPLRHVIILGRKNVQNMPCYYTVEQGKNTDWRGVTKWPHKTNQTLPCLHTKLENLACQHLSHFNGFVCVVYVFRTRIMQLIWCKMDFEN